ncbi:MAG: hypothetical protein OCD01_05040 [Fibrobacterales bacterium]
MKTLLLFTITLLLLFTGCELDAVENEPLSSESFADISSSDSEKVIVNTESQSSIGGALPDISSENDNQVDTQSSSSDPFAEPTEFLDNDNNHPRQQTRRLMAELDFVSASELEGFYFELDTLFLEYDYKMKAGSTLYQERSVVTRIRNDYQFEFKNGTLIHHTIGSAIDEYSYTFDGDELVLKSGFGHTEANGVFEESDLHYNVGKDGDTYYLILAEEITEDAEGKAVADTRTLFKWNYVMRKVENPHKTPTVSSEEDVTVSSSSVSRSNSSSSKESSSSVETVDEPEENPNSGCYQCPTGVICISGVENMVGFEACYIIP